MLGFVWNDSACPGAAALSRRNPGEGFDDLSWLGVACTEMKLPALLVAMLMSHAAVPRDTNN